MKHLRLISYLHSCFSHHQQQFYFKRILVFRKELEVEHRAGRGLGLGALISCLIAFHGDSCLFLARHKIKLIKVYNTNFNL